MPSQWEKPKSSLLKRRNWELQTVLFKTRRTKYIIKIIKNYDQQKNGRSKNPRQVTNKPTDTFNVVRRCPAKVLIEGNKMLQLCSPTKLTAPDISISGHTVNKHTYKHISTDTCIALFLHQKHRQFESKCKIYLCACVCVSYHCSACVNFILTGC